MWRIIRSLGCCHLSHRWRAAADQRMLQLLGHEGAQSLRRAARHHRLASHWTHRCIVGGRSGQSRLSSSSFTVGDSFWRLSIWNTKSHKYRCTECVCVFVYHILCVYVCVPHDVCPFHCVCVLPASRGSVCASCSVCVVLSFLDGRTCYTVDTGSPTPEPQNYFLLSESKVSQI